MIKLFIDNKDADKTANYLKKNLMCQASINRISLQRLFVCNKI